MQINGLINMLMTLPGAANSGLLGTDVNGQMLGDTLANGQQGQQFASLLGAGQTPLNPELLKSKGVLTGELLQNASAAEQPAPAEMSAEAVAIPVMPTFIDQPQNKDVLLTKDNVLANNASSKKLIWENEFVRPGKVAASEVTNPQNPAEKYSIEADKPELQAQAQPQNTKTADIQDDKQGKISLAKLDSAATNSIDQNEFAAAVSKLVQDKQKNTKADTHSITAKVGESKTVDLETKTAMNEKAAAFEELNQPQEVAAKVSPKILSVKSEELKHEVSEADQFATRLQELDAHLKSRDFNSIRATREAMAHTPAQQIQIQIQQAVKEGISDIKINLHPQELGAVDVSMKIDSDGNTQVHIVAERSETLDLLRRDSQNLTKSLADAGVQADANSLQFSLRGDQQGERNFGFNQNGGNGNDQPNRHLAATANDNYSRFTRLNEGDLKLSIANKSLNILV